MSKKTIKIEDLIPEYKLKDENIHSMDNYKGLEPGVYKLKTAKKKKGDRQSILIHSGEYSQDILTGSKASVFIDFVLEIANGNKELVKQSIDNDGSRSITLDVTDLTKIIAASGHPEGAH